MTAYLPLRDRQKPVRQGAARSYCPGPCERIPGGGTGILRICPDRHHATFVCTDGRRSGKHSLFYAGQRMLE